MDTITNHQLIIQVLQSSAAIPLSPLTLETAHLSHNGQTAFLSPFYFIHALPSISFLLPYPTLEGTVKIPCPPRKFSSSPGSK